MFSASVGIGDCLAAIQPYYDEARTGWAAAPAGPYKKRGVGIGAMWYGIGNTGVQNPSTARVEMDLDGTVILYTGCAGIGQGSSTVLSQIAAEVLGLAPQTVRLLTADTQFTTNAGATSASRQTYISGNAVKQAAEQLADVLRTEAADRLRAATSALVFDGGCVAVISGSTNGLVDTVVTNYEPYAVCYNPQREKIYVANRAADRVTVIKWGETRPLQITRMGKTLAEYFSLIEPARSAPA